jgi:hypothetical protein
MKDRKRNLTSSLQSHRDYASLHAAVVARQKELGRGQFEETIGQVFVTPLVASSKSARDALATCLLSRYFNARSRNGDTATRSTGERQMLVKVAAVA